MPYRARTKNPQSARSTLNCRTPAKDSPTPCSHSASDAAGNRLPEGIDKLLDNRLPFWGDRHYEYDAWGNIVRIKRGQNQSLVQSLIYNAKHQLVQLIETHHGKHQHTLTFSYDALGRRIRKEVFHQDDNGELKANYSYAESYLWRGNQQIQTRYYDKSKRCQRDQVVVYQPDSHIPLALLNTEKRISQLIDIDTDHLGTPKALYDHDTGKALWSAEHDTYGALKNETAEHTIYNLNLRFQGQYEDRETGLYYNFNRYYDPYAGRYVNHDPIGLMGGLNAYQYCPNPVSWVDPLGLMCKEMSVGGHLRDPRTIRFSQNTLNSKFDDGSTVNDLIWHFKNDPEYASTVEPTRLVKFKDLPASVRSKLLTQGVNEYSVFSLDNRRLYAARQAEVRVNSRWASPEELSSIDLERRFSTSNGGGIPRVK